MTNRCRCAFLKIEALGFWLPLLGRCSGWGSRQRGVCGGGGAGGPAEPGPTLELSRFMTKQKGVRGKKKNH